MDRGSDFASRFPGEGMGDVTRAFVRLAQTSFEEAVRRSGDEHALTRIQTILENATNEVKAMRTEGPPRTDFWPRRRTMPEWLIFVLVAWFVVRFLGRGQHRKRIREREREREGLAAAKTPPAVQSPAETEEERLRRRYVSGEMSVEQYERALDALYRKKSPG